MTNHTVIRIVLLIGPVTHSVTYQNKKKVRLTKFKWAYMRKFDSNLTFASIFFPLFFFFNSRHLEEILIHHCMMSSIFY